MCSKLGANKMNNEKIATLLSMRGEEGPGIVQLKKALRKALGEDAATYPGLATGSNFDADTELALRAWQARVGLVADGIAGPRTLGVLGITDPPSLEVQVDTALVGKVFPFTKTFNIDRNLPYVVAALAAFGLTDAAMVGVALATIRAETEGFVPIAELPSHFNTKPGLAAFSAYENRPDLGNKEAGDGAHYRGRGFVQLTGRANYAEYGKKLDIALEANPDIACAPEVAACLLAAYLAEHKNELSTALENDDLKKARKIVNGGTHGLERFTDALRRAQAAWNINAAPLVGAAKATHGSTRRAALKVTADPLDLRDRPYVPPPRSLPQEYPAGSDINKFLKAYINAKLILDQGQEGACTGFGLACVINYLRWRGNGMASTIKSVSPRMLYQFARRFDEYDGENYSGSSCRGALKGWYRNGVCHADLWPYAEGENTLPLAGWDSDAIEQPLGVYYRIDPQAIADMQAAILDVGAIYVSSYTHPGWDAVPKSDPPTSHTGLPVIPFDGKKSRKDGHAFALVGFNRTGFVIQNSWGGEWGSGGFAVISYADWLLHAMDVWVVALGVPGVVAGRLVSGDAEATRQGTAGAAARANWWDEGTAYRHSVVLGNNGRVTRYDPLDGVTRTLQNQACILPETWFRQNGEEKKRLVLYVHGGLNDEAGAIQRARAMGRYFLGNGCYPLFLVWKTGLLETLEDILSDKSGAEKAGGVRNWINDKITDPLLESTIGRKAARPIWTEMKENAALAMECGRGGDLLTDAISGLATNWKDKFELHLVGHSAGAIVLGGLLDSLAQKKLTDSVKSVHLYAPACTVAFANKHYAPHTQVMKNLYLDILSDKSELDDNVAKIYQKSLLYFVSNALEADSRTPILGLANVYDPQYSGWDGSSGSAEVLANWRDAVAKSEIIQQQRLRLHDEKFVVLRDAAAEKTENPSHGGFDNNVDIVGTTLTRILGHAPTLKVDDLVGF
jgi:hypothetical protein